MDFYAWVRRRGWAAPSPTPPSHLFMDGGKAWVPDGCNGEFLNAYAASVVKHPHDAPSVSEQRTPVFKLFLDCDIQCRPGDDAMDVVSVIQEVCSEAFGHSRCVVCEAPPKPLGESLVKAGKHLVWPDVWVDSRTALRFRDKLLEVLDSRLPGRFELPWSTVVDEAVFRGNGLRMPWSRKGPKEARAYVPTWEGSTRVGPVVGVAAVRRWVHDLSIRDPMGHTPPTPLAGDLPAASAGAPVACLDGQKKSLDAYARVLPRLHQALPPGHETQRFTGLIALQDMVILRSTSRFCANLGREHKSNNVYFVVTRNGLAQRCYCRCNTTEGRAKGLCKDFVSEWVSLDPTLIDAVIAGDAAAPPVALGLLPAAKAARAAADLGGLLAKSRPAIKKRRCGKLGK